MATSYILTLSPQSPTHSWLPHNPPLDRSGFFVFETTDTLTIAVCGFGQNPTLTITSNSTTYPPFTLPTNAALPWGPQALASTDHQGFKFKITITDQDGQRHVVDPEMIVQGMG